jgi:hypothetical protein
LGSTKAIPENIKTLLGIERNHFEKLVDDAFEMYRKGRFKMMFRGSAYAMSISDRDLELLVEKYKKSIQKVDEGLYSILLCIHFILFDEVNEMSSMLSESAAKELRERIKIVSELLDKDSSIKSSFYTYSLSKIPFFADLSWEAEIKVFNSPHDYLENPPETVSGRIEIGVLNPIKKLPEPSSFVFEISLKDVQNMINSLENLRKALENLENAKVVQKKD